MAVRFTMPTYDYTCSKCGHHFEMVQSMSAPVLKCCPKELCKLARWGKGRVTRGVGGGAGLIFKGSGFYITDYRSEGYKQSARKESEAASGKSSDAPAKTGSESPAKGATPSSDAAKNADKKSAAPAKND